MTSEMLVGAAKVVNHAREIECAQPRVDEGIEHFILAASRDTPHYSLAEAFTVLPALNPPTLTDSSWRLAPMSP